MLRFLLFGFPVRVHWMFLLVCVIFGGSWLKQPGRVGLIGFLISSVVVFISILWHELGHAWARRRCKLQHSEILLYGMGGLCGGPGYLTRKQTIFVAAMGPAAGLLLGAATALLLLIPVAYADGVETSSSFFLRNFVGMMLFVNIGWSLVNLLPVLPLDGGRIFEAIVANKSHTLPAKVGMIVAAVVAMLALIFKFFFAAILFGYLAYTNYQRATGTHRGGFF